jgi:hypothetical protein
LAQLPKSERIDKLQQTFKGVEDDYLRLLRVGSNGVNGDNMETDDDEDDEGDDDGDGEEQGDERPAKRVRVG